MPSSGFTVGAGGQGLPAIDAGQRAQEPDDEVDILRGSSRPSWLRAMMSTASASEAALPSWKYGDVTATLRRTRHAEDLAVVLPAGDGIAAKVGGAGIAARRERIIENTEPLE